MSVVSLLTQCVLQLHANSCHRGLSRQNADILQVPRPRQTYLGATGDHGETGNNLPKITIEFMVALELAQNQKFLKVTCRPLLPKFNASALKQPRWHVGAVAPPGPAADA
jgi:hypothetical protein